jgi:hypothetical protein
MVLSSVRNLGVRKSVQPALPAANQQNMPTLLHNPCLFVVFAALQGIERGISGDMSTSAPIITHQNHATSESHPPHIGATLQNSRARAAFTVS